MNYKILVNKSNLPHEGDDFLSSNNFMESKPRTIQNPSIFLSSIASSVAVGRITLHHIKYCEIPKSNKKKSID